MSKLKPAANLLRPQLLPQFWELETDVLTTYQDHKLLDQECFSLMFIF